MKRLAAVVAVVVLVGCSSGDGEDGPGDEEAQTCAELLSQPVTDETFDGACLHDGEPFVMARAFLDCDDGRVLWWNELGWGFEGEPAMLGVSEPPAEAVAECTPPEPTSAPPTTTFP